MLGAVVRGGQWAAEPLRERAHVGDVVLVGRVADVGAQLVSRPQQGTGWPATRPVVGGP